MDFLGRPSDLDRHTGDAYMISEGQGWSQAIHMKRKGKLVWHEGGPVTTELTEPINDCNHNWKIVADNPILCGYDGNRSISYSPYRCLYCEQLAVYCRHSKMKVFVFKEDAH